MRSVSRDSQILRVTSYQRRISSTTLMLRRPLKHWLMKRWVVMSGTMPCLPHSSTAAAMHKSRKMYYLVQVKRMWTTFLHCVNSWKIQILPQIHLLLCTTDHSIMTDPLDQIISLISITKIWDTIVLKWSMWKIFMLQLLTTMLFLLGNIV